MNTLLRKTLTGAVTALSLGAMVVATASPAAATRSGQPCTTCASATGPGCNPCVAIAKAPAASAMKKIGTVLIRLRHCHRPSTHQAQSNSTNGKITVDDLLAIANAAKSNVSA